MLRRRVMVGGAMMRQHGGDEHLAVFFYGWCMRHWASDEMVGPVSTSARGRLDVALAAAW